MPRGGVLTRFYRPGGGGFELFFPEGWGIRPSKKCLGVFPGGWSGLELTDTLAFVNFITLITLRWFGQFITSRGLFLASKLIAFLYISNLKCTGAQLWNSQTGFKLKKKQLSL